MLSHCVCVCDDSYCTYCGIHTSPSTVRPKTLHENILPYRKRNCCCVSCVKNLLKSLLQKRQLRDVVADHMGTHSEQGVSAVCATEDADDLPAAGVEALFDLPRTRERARFDVRRSMASTISAGRCRRSDRIGHSIICARIRHAQCRRPWRLCAHPGCQAFP